jgi:hypothetical protein
MFLSPVSFINLIFIHLNAECPAAGRKDSRMAISFLYFQKKEEDIKSRDVGAPPHIRAFSVARTFSSSSRHPKNISYTNGYWALQGELSQLLSKPTMGWELGEKHCISR